MRWPGDNVAAREPSGSATLVDADFHGSMGGQPFNQPMVGMTGD